MRFPDAFLRTLKDRASIAEYARTKLAFDMRKSQPQNGDYWACCPIHGEKTASFHVRDSHGSYKCFGCGASGGVLDLAMELEGLSFPEAVERIADFAGVPLPESPKDDRAEREAALHTRALAACAAAAALYAKALRSPEGAEARAYLESRGLGPGDWERFGLGYAPGGWTRLIDALAGQGFTLAELVAAGLTRGPNEGKRAIDFLRNRLTFRIDNAAGKPIAFGGRRMDPEDHGKYINSPDSLLFHKSHVLYRFKAARELLARRRAGPDRNHAEGLIVCEGYFDVIAFERAGLPAVAPMGTALTPDQLAMAWRAGGEPVLCFDGDGAGQRAGAKSLMLALPQFGPDKTVRIAFAPPGKDPDDLAREGGEQALHALVANASPAVDALFAIEQAVRPLTTPEAQAGFKARLRKAAAAIEDEETRRLYLRALLERADALLRPQRPSQPFPPRSSAPLPKGARGGRTGTFQPLMPATQETKGSLSGTSDTAVRALLGAAIDHPDLAVRHAEELASLPTQDALARIVRDCLLDLAATDAEIDRGRVSERLTANGAIDAAQLIHHLPTLVGERAASSDDRAEAALTVQEPDEQHSIDDLKAPGATRERVSRRAAKRRAVAASPVRLTAEAQAEFARRLSVLAERGAMGSQVRVHLEASEIGPQERSFSETPAPQRAPQTETLDLSREQTALAQAMLMDRLRAARAARSDADDA